MQLAGCASKTLLFSDTSGQKAPQDSFKVGPTCGRLTPGSAHDQFMNIYTHIYGTEDFQMRVALAPPSTHLTVSRQICKNWSY